MKRSVYFTGMVFLMLFSVITFSHASPPVKKRNVGTLVVQTRDSDWDKLGFVSFTLDEKEYKTNNNGLSEGKTECSFFYSLDRARRENQLSRGNS